MPIRGAGVVLVAVLVSGAGAAAPAGGAPPAPPKERRLHLAGAEASSHLVNDWNKFQENYLPLYVGDDDPRTAWNLQTEGIGEWRSTPALDGGLGHARQPFRLEPLQR